MLERVYPGTTDRPHSWRNQGQRVLLSQIFPKRHNSTRWYRQRRSQFTQGMLRWTGATCATHFDWKSTIFNSFQAECSLCEIQVERNTDVKGVLHKNIKRRLKQEFRDNLMFYHESRWENKFVCHKNISIEEDEWS